MAFGAVLFDLDGTLADTRPWYLEILVADLKVPEAAARSSLSAHRPPVTIARDYGIARSRLLAACRSAQERLRAFPFAQETIAGLRARNVPLGLVTHCPRDLAEIVLQATQLGPLFDVVQPFQAGVPPKPRPESLLLALRALAVEPSAAVVYVGDTVRDSEAASNAGLSFGWIPFGYGDSRPPNTTWTLARLDTLLEIADR